jgi:hypothetical protein
VTKELILAVEMGYNILEIYEVYHFPRRTEYDPESKRGGLFTEYMNLFLRLKEEASGWPTWCETAEDKQKYLDLYYENEGIRLDPKNIPDEGMNHGKRSWAKLMLNSFWGRFGMRLEGKTQTEILRGHQAGKILETLGDRAKDLKSFHILSDHALMMEWENAKGFTPDNMTTNIFIACLTTCWARMKLYEALQTVGLRALYCDTDSIIFCLKPGEEGIPLGFYLGEMTDELGGHHIVEFVSGGCKQYAYTLSNGDQCCKVRGFTLNHKNSKLINLESIKDLITSETPGGTIDTVNPSKITRNKVENVLFNVREKKTYRIVFDKRVLLPNFDTVPYGYKRA